MSLLVLPSHGISNTKPRHLGTPNPMVKQRMQLKQSRDYSPSAVNLGSRSTKHYLTGATHQQRGLELVQCSGSLDVGAGHYFQLLEYFFSHAIRLKKIVKQLKT